MTGMLKTVLITVATIVVLMVAVGLFVIYTGSYDVSATEPHWRVTRWALGTLREHSVAARADGVTGSPPTDSAGLAEGFEHFHAMCVECHGAPGVDRGEPGKGMNPRPPRLEREAEEWTDAQLFWITKHGMRLAGMPAFGPTHADEQIWEIVGAIRAVAGMTEVEYAERVRALTAREETPEGAPEGTEAGEHTHAPGTEAHEH